MLYTNRGIPVLSGGELIPQELYGGKYFIIIGSEIVTFSNRSIPWNLQPTHG